MFFKLARLIHFQRIFLQLNIIFDKCLYSRGYNKQKIAEVTDIVKLIVFIAIFSHVLACMWLKIGFLDPRESWIRLNEDTLDGNDVVHIYIFAFYWIIETITTVGYGDYSGTTHYELMFSMALMVSLFYSLISFADLLFFLF